MASTVIRTVPTGFGEQSNKLSASVEAARVNGIKNFIQTRRLDSTVQLAITTTIRGSKEGAPSLNEYHVYLAMLGRFAALVGDYRTACICDRDMCPRNPLPADPKTIARFYHWKSGGSNDVLLDPSTGEIVKDIDGNILLCTGEWNSPSCINEMQAALTNLHRTYANLRGAYQDECKDCRAANGMTVGGDHDNIPASGTWRSCICHSGCPLLVARGDATVATETKDAFNKVKAAMKSKHVVRGNCCLYPRDVRTLHKYLVSSARMYYQQLYTMIILGIKLFFRADELLSLSVDDFKMSLAVIHPDSVRSLAVSVQGKSDEKGVILKLWRDDENPEFCPIRLLLTYLKVAGIKSGYVFPRWSDLKASMNSKTGDGHFDRPLAYNDFLGRLKTVLCQCLPHQFKKDTNTMIGTHTLRKTAYLFAMWGVAQHMSASEPEKPICDVLYAGILKSARHSSIQNAATYIKDGSTFYEIVKEERFQEDQRVSSWRCIHLISDSKDSGKRATEPSRLQQMVTVSEQADWYFRHEVSLGDGLSFQSYYHRACCLQPKLTCREQLCSLVAKGISTAAEKAEHNCLLRSVEAEIARQNSLDAISSHPQQQENQDQGPVDSGGEPSKKKRRKEKRGSDDLVHLKAQCKVLERAKSDKEACWKAYKEARVLLASSATTLTDGARRWARYRAETATKMEECIQKCHSGDEAAFFSQDGWFLATNYRCACKKE